MRRRILAAAAAATSVVMLSGCGFDGLNSYTLPGTKGTGSDSIEIKAEFQNMANLVENQPVLVDDINVGTITDIELRDWTPVATMSLKNDIVLPANATATVGQTSLLGAKHIQLAPPTDAAPEGRLQDGAVIPLERTRNAPETEDVLASVSLLLNGGGLQHIDTIARELNRAMGGRTQDYTALFTELNTFIGGLDDQKHDILGAIESINRLAVNLNQGMPDIQKALDTAPQALETLNQDIPGFVEFFKNFDYWNDHVPVFDEVNKNLTTILSNLGPTLVGLADAGKSTVEGARMLSGVIFPLDGIADGFRGDGAYVDAMVDLTLQSLDRTFLTGTPFEGILSDADKFLQFFRGAGQAANPLTAPLEVVTGPLNGITGAPGGLLGGVLGGLGGGN